MTQESLSKWLKGVIAGIAVCGAVIYFYLVPVLGQEAAAAYPEFSHCYIPWLIVIWLTAVPCYMVLYFGWKITMEIKKDNSFSMTNSWVLCWWNLQG